MNGATRVNSVLDFLSRHERYAELSNKRSERFHFQECWCLVFRAFYGEYKVPHVAPKPAPVITDVTIVLEKRPKWFTDKYSCPMRRVIEVITRKGTSYDVLECGHKIESRIDGSTAKHRRCKKEECKRLGTAKMYAAAVKADEAMGRIAKRVKSAVTNRPRRRVSC